MDSLPAERRWADTNGSHESLKKPELNFVVSCHRTLCMAAAWIDHSFKDSTLDWPNFSRWSGRQVKIRKRSLPTWIPRRRGRETNNQDRRSTSLDSPQASASFRGTLIENQLPLGKSLCRCLLFPRNHMKRKRTGESSIVIHFGTSFAHVFCVDGT